MCCVLSSLDTSSKNKLSSTWYLSSASWLKSARVAHFVDCAKYYFASLVKSIESFPSKDCRCKSCESSAGSLQCVEVPWAIPWACWAIMLFSSMKCSGRNVFMNKSLTFQHLHLEGNTAWVVIIWSWKARSLFKSYVLSMFRRGPLGMIQGLLEQRGVSLLTQWALD